MAQTIKRASLPEETRKRYLSYAMSVITSRALPDVRDGLKPVQRRILYTMGHDLKLSPDARLLKSAKVVGQVMGDYHPHGDQAIYDAMVRLAQDFALRYPLIDGQGNFGSLDGDPPAAMRYTEMRLRPIAMESIEDLKESTIDFRPTFDGRKEEPVVLPARLPQLLLNGATGIAVGMATSIPPHNLRELLRACTMLIADRETPVAKLLQVVKGPDLPTGAEIVTDRQTLATIYETGRGTVRMRGTWQIERDGRKTHVIVDSIPYAVQKATIVEKIGELIAARKVPQATDVRDESTDEVRIVIEIRSPRDAEAVMAYFYRHTQLSDTLAVNLTCLVPSPETGGTRPERLDLRSLLVYFLDFRFEVVTRRLEHQLRRLEQRIHILEGFARVFDALDEAIRIVRRSDGRQDAQQKLMKRFELDEPQSDAVLETKIYRLAKLEISKILQELKAKQKEARRIRGLLKSAAKRWQVVGDELAELEAAYGDPRRTKIVLGADKALTYDEEDFIVAEDTHVVVTRDGWIKRIVRLKSAQSTRTREGDAVAWVLPGSTRANVAFFSNLGSAYVMRINDVPATSGYGEPIQKYFRFADGERIVGALSLDPRLLAEEDAHEDEDGAPPSHLLFAATKAGHVLRFRLNAHLEPSQKSGRRYARPVGGGDEVITASLCTHDKPFVVMAAANGRAIAYALEEVSILSGPGKGVRGMKLEGNATVVAAGLSSGRGDPLRVATTRGTVRDLTPVTVKVIARGGKGQAVLKREGFAEAVPAEVQIPQLEADDAEPGEGDGDAEE